MRTAIFADAFRSAVGRVAAGHQVMSSRTSLRVRSFQCPSHSRATLDPYRPKVSQETATVRHRLLVRRGTYFRGQANAKCRWHSGTIALRNAPCRHNADQRAERCRVQQATIHSHVQIGSRATRKAERAYPSARVACVQATGEQAQRLRKSPAAKFSHGSPTCPRQHPTSTTGAT